MLLGGEEAGDQKGGLEAHGGCGVEKEWCHVAMQKGKDVRRRPTGHIERECREGESNLGMFGIESSGGRRRSRCGLRTAAAR